MFITGITIQNFLQSEKIDKNEKAVITALKCIIGTDLNRSDINLIKKNGNCYDFFDGDPKKTEIVNGNKSGYFFRLVTYPPTNASSTGFWSVAAWPIKYRKTGIQSFYVDRLGVVRGSDVGGNIGNNTSLPIIKD